MRAYYEAFLGVVPFKRAAQPWTGPSTVRWMDVRTVQLLHRHTWSGISAGTSFFHVFH